MDKRKTYPILNVLKGITPEKLTQDKMIDNPHINTEQINGHKITFGFLDRPKMRQQKQNSGRGHHGCAEALKSTLDKIIQT